MKTRRLRLGKETLRSLRHEELGKAAGAFTDVSICALCAPTAACPTRICGTFNCSGNLCLNSYECPTRAFPCG